MSNELNSKVLTDEELEAVNGGLITLTTDKFSIEIDTREPWKMDITEISTGSSLTIGKEKMQKLKEQAGGTWLLVKSFLQTMTFSDIVALLG